MEVNMKNITLSIDEYTLKAGREYAKKHHMSFNALVRHLLEKTVKKSSNQWIEEAFKLMDEAKANSNGQKWKRKDLYRV
jgi:Ca2+-binding EF-hand superfamily protein